MAALRAAVVRVVCLVVHHQLIVHKVEAVGLRLVRVQDHLPDCGVGVGGVGGNKHKNESITIIPTIIMMTTNSFSLSYASTLA